MKTGALFLSTSPDPTGTKPTITATAAPDPDVVWDFEDLLAAAHTTLPDTTETTGTTVGIALAESDWFALWTPTRPAYFLSDQSAAVCDDVPARIAADVGAAITVDDESRRAEIPCTPIGDATLLEPFGISSSELLQIVEAADGVGEDAVYTICRLLGVPEAFDLFAEDEETV